VSIRKTLFISPSLLYKDDMFAFEKFLKECEAGKNCEFQVHGFVDGKEISTKPCQTLQELFAGENILDQLDQLVFEVNEIGDNREVIRNVRVNLDKRVSDIELSTEDKNNVWVKEIGPKLKSFFKKRRPWYWFIGLSIPPVFNLTLGLSLVMLAFIFVTNVTNALIFPSISILSGAIFMAFGVKRLVFRHARICYFQREEDVRPNYELFAIVVHLTVLIFAILGTVIMTAGKY